MAISDLPILSMLRTKMQWHQERQRRPGRKCLECRYPEIPAARSDAAELRPPAAGAGVARGHERRASGRIVGRPSRFGSSREGGYEARPSGNAVSLEDEMMKVASNQMDYQAATTLYSRSLGLVKTAHRQDAEEAAHGFPQIDIDRGVRSARAGRPHARDRGKYRQRGFDREDRGRRSLPAQDPDLPDRDRPHARRARRHHGPAENRSERFPARSISPAIRPPTPPAT